MITRILALYTIGVSLSLAGPEAIIKKFQGSYVSDREATIPEVKKVKQWNEKAQKIVTENLGELRLTIKGNKVISQHGKNGEVISAEYKVLKHGKDWLLMTVDETQPLKYRIVIDDKGFWQTSEGTGVTFRERFRKIKQAEQVAAPDGE